MQFQLLGKDDQKNYDAFVAANQSGSFLQSWRWGEWQKQFGHDVARVAVIENSVIIAAAQVIIMKIPKMNRHYLYIPYGPLFANVKAAQLLIRQLRTHFPETLFLRVEPKNQIELPGRITTHIQPGKTSVLNLSLDTEQLLKRMHQKTRYNIKVAQKHGVQIIVEPVITPGHGLHLSETVDLLVNTASRQNYRSHGKAYYEKLIDFFSNITKNPDNCTISIYKALLGTELLAAALMIDFGQTRTYLFGGSSDAQRNAMAPYAMHWQAILDAKTAGMKQYDFWGIETASGESPGFVRFKLGWGGDTAQYPPAADIIYKPLWYKAYSVLRTINRKI